MEKLLPIVRVLAKVLEKHVTQVLGNFLLDQSFLSPQQAGFSPGHSTESVMLSVLGDLWQHSGCDQPAALILLELSVAFARWSTIFW